MRRFVSDMEKRVYDFSRSPRENTRMLETRAKKGPQDEVLQTLMIFSRPWKTRPENAKHIECRVNTASAGNIKQSRPHI